MKSISNTIHLLAVADDQFNKNQNLWHNNVRQYNVISAIENRTTCKEFARLQKTSIKKRNCFFNRALY